MPEFTVAEFRKALLEDARASAAEERGGTAAPFVALAAEQLVGANLFPDFTPAFYQGTGFRGRRMRVDGYAFDEADGSAYLIIADFRGSEEPPTLTRTEAQQTLELAVRFADEALNHNLQSQIEISLESADLVDELISRRGRTSRYHVWLVTDAVASARFDALPASELNGVPLDYQVADVERLMRLAAADSDHEPLEVDFREFAPGGLPCLEAGSTHEGGYRSFLAVVPGEALARLFEQFGARLLEGNVRSFLTAKGAVNRQIRTTILRKPHMFFAFNNGIAATAADVQVERRGAATFVTSARDLQIINGGQTTASIANARYRDGADLRNVAVPMKLLDISEAGSQAADLMQDIAKSSNTQNKVSDADFSSSHAFHRRMEQISRRIYAPSAGGQTHDTRWFYERARGQYAQEQVRMTRSEQAKFLRQVPKAQVITKTDFAKAQNAWAQKPHIVSKGAQSNFTDFADWVGRNWSEENDTRFNDQYYRDSVAKVLVYRDLERSVSAAPWYGGGYRANIVCYTISLLQYLVSRYYPTYDIEFSDIWARQAVPQALSTQLIRIAARVQDVLSTPPSGSANVTQWCKQSACWEAVKRAPVGLDATIESVLASQETSQSAKKVAKRDQATANELDLQTGVMNLGAEYWKSLARFALEKHVATPSVTSALATACAVPAEVPSSKQCKLLLQFRDRAVQQGWLQPEEASMARP